MDTTLTRPSGPAATTERAAVRRVSVSNATATTPPMIRVFFRDAEAARHGHEVLAKQLPYLAADSRTRLDLGGSQPTLTYAVL